jgi:hypothetical protein
VSEPTSSVRATTQVRVDGADLSEPTRVIRGELGAPHLVPLITATGLPGTTDLVRTVVALRDLPVSLTPHGWRLTGARAGDDRAARMARSHSDTLLGITADVLAGEPAGPTMVNIVGPATLMARLALPGGEPVLADPGAVRDVSQAWDESMAALAAGIELALPGAEVVLDVAEPDLGPVTSGTVRSSSGYRTLPAWDRAEVGAAWTRLAQSARCILPLQAVDLPGLADLPALGAPRSDDVADARPPQDARGARATPTPGTQAEPAVGRAQQHADASAAPRIAVRCDLPSTPQGYEPVAAWIEAGRDVVVTTPVPAPGPGRTRNLARSVAAPWRGLGLAAESLSQLVLCTVPGGPQSPAGLRDAAAVARDCADALDMVRHDDLEAIS